MHVIHKTAASLGVSRRLAWSGGSGGKEGGEHKIWMENVANVIQQIHSFGASAIGDVNPRELPLEFSHLFCMLNADLDVGHAYICRSTFHTPNRTTPLTHIHVHQDRAALSRNILKFLL